MGGPYTLAMDPVVIRALAEVIGPLGAVLACGAIPVALVYLSKHFKLRTRELELEAELHGRDSQARLQALETRLSAMEAMPPLPPFPALVKPKTISPMSVSFCVIRPANGART